VTTLFEQLLKSAKEEAKGIPSRKIMHPPNKGLSAGELIDYVIQQHDAHRAGKHFDLRAGKKGLGLHSFATRRDVLENLEPGGIAELAPQSTHSYKYKDFEGEIGPPGVYGAGTVKTHSKGKLLLTKVTPDAIHFTTADNKPENRYALIKNNDRWMLIRPHSISATGVKKEHYTSIPPEKIDAAIKNLKDTDVVQPKLDGALVQLLLRANKKPEILSHRTSKETGNPIVHTERFFGGRPEMPELNEHKDSVLLGELFGTRNGKAIPVQELGGILNSTIANSLDRQKKQNVELKTMLFDIAKHKGKTQDQPYAERKKVLETIFSLLPKDKFQLPEEAKKEDARQLLRRIQSGRHPLTTEGVVIHHEDKKPTKLKLTDEHDVYVKDIFPAAKDSKYHRRGVGGFTYSLEPNGAEVGRVGSGLSDQLRQDMFSDPESYLGRIARIRAQGQFDKTKAFRAPTLLGLHQDY
jgi:hypothetical protein